MVGPTTTQPGVRTPAPDTAPQDASPPRGAPSPDRPPGPPHARHRPPRRALAILLLLVLVLGVAVRLVLAPPWMPTEGPLTASGTLEADEVMVSPEVAGRLVELVREGQEVRAGDLVARLDDSLVQVQFRQGDVAARQQLEIQLERYRIRAPISGTVTRVPMHVGEVVAPGQPVAAIADLSTLKLTAYVLERDLGRVQTGQEVTVTADPFGARAFSGVVTSTNPRAEFTPRNVQTQRDRLNLVFGVKVRVDNPDRALKPGMPVDASFAPLP